MTERMKLTPCTCFSHDEKEGRLGIQVQLLGADKKDISLEMRKDNFCVSGPRGIQSIRDASSYPTWWNPRKQKLSMKTASSKFSLPSKIGSIRSTS